MLEKVDLSRKLGKKEYRQAVKELGAKIGDLQRRQREAGIPVMVVFEGWEGAGKGAQMNQLILPLDPRGFRVQNVTDSFTSDPFYPPMYPFWNAIPPAGRMSIYNRSWYRKAIDSWREPNEGNQGLERKLGEIRSFERQLADGGYLLIKLFLHIDRSEQKKRLQRLKGDGSKGVRGQDELNAYKNYDSILPVLEEVMRETDRAYAPWTIVEAHDRRFATVKVLSVVARALENRLNQPKVEVAKEPVVLSELEEAVTTPTVLSKVDLSLEPDDNYKKEMGSLQRRIRRMEYTLYRKRRPMVLAFEGWDAAGKGGCIKRLTEEMDPRGYEVIPVGAPNDFERRHHYLWRFWQDFPKAGHVAIFDRTWYGRVLVERVEGYCSPLDWRRAYSEINDMEKQWHDSGAIVMKFWLQIDKDEQLRRFQSREETPEKNWKITDEDWRNREKWDLYEKAVEEMLWRTSTPYAPWTIVEANSKAYARLKVLRTVLERGEEAL
nr:polyphosphate:AMP phosphotransferase [uncultured Dethiosulfovibrio sp.]